jgi:hypothetical protein
VSAIDELRSHDLGAAFLDLLGRTVRAVAVARNFPAPEGHSQWDDAAVASTVTDFLAHPNTPRRLTDLETHCRTDDALRRRLQATVQNFLADTGRRTPVGRLVLRFNEVLAGASSFERQGRTWALVGMSGEPAAVDIDALVSAASMIDVHVPAAWTTGSRKSPDLDGESVVRVATAVLSAAGGPLSASVLAQVTALRLGIGGAPMSIEAAAFDPPEAYDASADTTGVAAIRGLRAAEVFGLLNDAERISIGMAGVPVARLGPILGMSGSSAALVRKRALATLKDQLEDEEDGQPVADTVLELARTWAESWMTTTDATY